MNMVCIVCPIGCTLTVTPLQDGYSVMGNTCKKGETFAVNEMTNPLRSLTTTVKTTFPAMPMLPVRTDGEVPKGKLFELMAAVNQYTLKKPVRCGDIIIENVLDTHCNIIASCNLE